MAHRAARAFVCPRNCSPAVSGARWPGGLPAGRALADRLVVLLPGCVGPQEHAGRDGCVGRIRPVGCWPLETRPRHSRAGNGGAGVRNTSPRRSPEPGSSLPVPARDHCGHGYSRLVGPVDECPPATQGGNGCACACGPGREFPVRGPAASGVLQSDGWWPLAGISSAGRLQPRLGAGPAQAVRVAARAPDKPRQPGVFWYGSTPRL